MIGDKFQGEISFISTARENTFEVVHSENDKTYTCHCAYLAQWDRLYDFMGAKKIELRPLRILENGDLIVRILN